VTYTIIVAAKRPIKGTPELWDIIETKAFNEPRKFYRYIKEHIFILRTNGTKLELHEGRKNRLNVARKPMIVKYMIPSGKTSARPCIMFPNGNIQEVRDFTRHWKQMLQELIAV
jgi:hypothetical protein